MNVGKAIATVVITFILLILWAFFWWQYSRADVAQLIGTTNTEDARINGSVPPTKNYNYGGAVYVAVDADGAIRFVIRPKNVAAVLGVGATISACVCSVYCSVPGASSNTVSAYRNFKSDWVEGDEDGVDDDDGDVTWNDWASDASEWATAGCDNADDGGSDNTGDGSGADRKATAEDATAVGTVPAWCSWDISTDLAQAWYAGTATGGLIFISGGNIEKRFHSSEYADADYHPRFFITFTTDGEEAAPLMRRRKLLENLLQGEVENEKNPFVFGSSGLAGWTGLDLRNSQ